MSIAQILLPELDHEAATTRRLLARVPEDRASWTPHARSTPLGGLAMHLATLPRLAVSAIEQDELDVNPPGGPGFSLPAFTTTAELLAAHDATTRAARDAIAGAADALLLQPWTLKNAGQTIFTLPRAAVLRTMYFSHMIHHRGQLSVYLRLLDVPVPSIYGPSADEPM